MKTRPKMTFKQFSKWYKHRLVDQYWTLPMAMLYTKIYDDVRFVAWWRREKYFQSYYDNDSLYRTVCEINDEINYNRAKPKGEFE